MNRTDKLRHEAIFALAGADYVRAKLVELLNTGPENLASHVYAVKCRVKDEGSLIRKVLFKRTEERKKSYSPSSATDIVGLRLLALSNERLPLIVERFIDFISFCQSPNIALFAGSALSHAVKEVKIYKSENNPVVYDQIYSFFSEKDFGDDSKKPIIELTQSTKDDPYSSVHIVCRANSHYQRNPKEIPVEIQIRTVFEDAWAEIDHPLRYKGASYLSRNRSERYSDLKKTADKFLGDLKKSVDQCLHFTDDIQNLYSRISRTFGRRTTPSVVRFTPSGVRVAYDETVLRATPPQIRSEFENSETNIELLTRKSMDQRRYAANLRLCNRILTSLDQTEELYRKKFPSIHLRDKEFLYHFKMEKAFVLLSRNKILTLRSPDPLEIQKNNKAALELYLEMDRDHNYNKDPILKFRLATALSIAQNDDLARQKLRQAVSALRDDARIPQQHLLRVTIPRQYSFALWRRKQSIWNAGAHQNNFKYRVDEQRTLLADCIKYIVEAMSRLSKVSSDSVDKELENLRCWNNYISYVWEARSLSMPDVTLSSQKMARLREVLPEMERRRNKYTRRLSGLDTSLKAADLLGDKGKIRRYTKLIRSEFGRQANARRPEYSQDELDYVKYCLDEVSRGG